MMIFFRLEILLDVSLDHRDEEKVDLPGVDCFCLIDRQLTDPALDWVQQRAWLE